MKSYLKILIVFTALFSTAELNKARAQYVPVVYGTYVSGVYLGWGYYPVVNGYWPWDYYNYAAWRPYGYSYWSYWNYQPYYASYGAISYSPSTNRVGVAWGTPDSYSAQSSAQNYCQQSDCSPVVWVQGGCAAISRGTPTERVYYAYHTTRYAAQNSALRACHNDGASECRVGAWVCSW